MKSKKKGSFLTAVIVNIVAHFLYIAGLSIIIPILFLFFFPSQLWSAVNYAKPILISAIVLVVLSMIVLYVYNKSIGKTLFNLGLATFVPGAIALVFSIYNKEIVFGFIRSYFSAFEFIEPLLDSYLAHVIPTVWAVTIAYIVIGFVFIIFGVQRLRRESTKSLAKKVFGKRARIVR
ncbi:hypothetical protein GF358_04360 [Candidatus Woesearchaeota archaeon]|nr:hypothetical protein [Candidatus Woesearchaeota archaeon]